jgi:hypothetical protein
LATVGAIEGLAAAILAVIDPGDAMSVSHQQWVDSIPRLILNFLHDILNNKKQLFRDYFRDRKMKYREIVFEPCLHRY